MDIKFLITVFIWIAILSISILTGFLVYYKQDKAAEDRILEAQQALYNGSSKKQSIISLSEKKYNELQVYLSTHGANYVFNRVIEPMEFYIYRIVLSCAGVVIGYLIYQLIGAVLGGIAGFYLLKLLIELSNNHENDYITEDLLAIYENIKIKTESGVFLTDALSSCYKVANSERLKKELKILNTDIIVNGNIMKALEKFKLKFSCVHINTFCSVLRQAYETGDSMAALSNVTVQLQGIQRAIEIKRNKKLDNDIMQVMLVVLLAIMAVVIYAVYYSFINLNVF